MLYIVEDIMKKAEAFLQQHNKNSLLIAIDGMCGAGKSTLGSLLQERLGGNLFHMDDFFLQPHQRTEERLNEIGGNVDYERFNEEILRKLEDAESFEYGVFDCSKQCINRRVYAEKKRVSIIEGSYCLHPYFKKKADICIFLEVEKEEQIRRIRERNTTEQVKRFKDEWIPKENVYFSTFAIREKCICYDTTECIFEKCKNIKEGEKGMVGLIVAYSKNRVIGKDGQIPWRIKGEQKRFKELTTGNVVIMGRRSYEEIGRPLPNRYTIVVSNTQKFEAENCTTVGSLKEALEIADKTKNVYISGGAGLYKEAIDIVDKMFITEIDAVIEGDTYFPEFEKEDFEREVECFVDGDLPYAYVTYTRKKYCKYQNAL